MIRSGKVSAITAQKPSSGMPSTSAVPANEARRCASAAGSVRVPKVSDVRTSMGYEHICDDRIRPTG